MSAFEGWPLCSSSSRLSFPLQNLNSHCTTGLLAVPGPNASLMLWVVSTALQRILKLNKKSAQICFLSNIISVCCCCSVAKSCLTLHDPIDCSMLGFPVLHHLPELAHDHVLYWWFNKPSHPLSPSSANNISKHQSVFQWVSCSNQVAKALELQHQSFWWIFRVDFL